MPAVQTMPSLYRRLKQIGYDQDFLRRVVLPDWWDDSLAEDPTSRLQAELRVSQRLSLPLADVTNPNKAFQIPDVAAIRLKRAKVGTERADIAPGLIAARNAVALVLPHLQGVPPLPANLTVADLRKWGSCAQCDSGFGRFIGSLLGTWHRRFSFFAAAFGSQEIRRDGILRRQPSGDCSCFGL